MPNNKKVATKLTYREYKDGVLYRTINVDILNPGYGIDIISKSTYETSSEAYILNRISTILSKLNIVCPTPYTQYYTSQPIQEDLNCKPDETFIVRYDEFYCRIQGSANIGESIIETYINSKVGTSIIVARYLNDVAQGVETHSILTLLGIDLDQLRRADEGLLKSYESKMLNSLKWDNNTPIVIGVNASKHGELYINADDCSGEFAADGMWSDPICRVLEDGTMNGECFNMNLTITVEYNG